VAFAVSPFCLPPTSPSFWWGSFLFVFQGAQDPRDQGPSADILTPPAGTQVTGEYGAFHGGYGTLVVVVLALLIAVPLGS